MNGSLVKKCKEAGVSYSRVHYWISKYNYSFEEAVKLIKEAGDNHIAIHMSKGPNNYKNRCKAVGVSYNTLYKYAQRHNISFEEALSNLENGEKEKSIKERCKENGFNYGSFQHFRRSKEYVDIEQALSDYRAYKSEKDSIAKEKSLSQLCYEYNVNFERAKGNKIRWGTSNRETIDRCLELDKNKEESLMALSKKYGVSYSSCQYYKNTYGLSNIEAVRKALKSKNESCLAEICREQQLPLEKIKYIKRKNHCSNEEAVEIFLSKNK